MRDDYSGIVEEQIKVGIIEEVPQKPTGERVFYMPLKPVVKAGAVTIKVRWVFDASAKPHPLANRINDCMFTGSSLQPLLWDIIVRARMSENLLLADIEKAFLQISVKEENRDAFRFLFNVKGEEKQLRFKQVPFGVEASPFLFRASLQYHLEQQEPGFEDAVHAHVCRQPYANWRRYRAACKVQAPVVQRPDNFIRWIRYYLGLKHTSR